MFQKSEAWKERGGEKIEGKVVNLKEIMSKTAW